MKRRLTWVLVLAIAAGVAACQPHGSEPLLPPSHTATTAWSTTDTANAITVNANEAEATRVRLT